MAFDSRSHSHSGCQNSQVPASPYIIESPQAVFFPPACTTDFVCLAVACGKLCLIRLPSQLSLLALCAWLICMFLWLPPAAFFLTQKNLKQNGKAMPARDTSETEPVFCTCLRRNVAPCIKYSWCPLHLKSCIDKINRRETVEVQLSYPETLQPYERLATCNVSQLIVLLAAIVTELLPLPPHSEDPGVQWAGLSWDQAVQVGRLAPFVALISFTNFLRNESEMQC